MAFYTPVQNVRAFRRMTGYDQINWNDFREVVNAFHGRIDDWYILPTKELIRHREGGHYAFAIMALNCLLIDTLSQFYYGALTSSGRRFKDFVRDCIPTLAGNLPTPINQPVSQHNQTGDPLRTYEEVLYTGFRCGILHQAHVPLYGVLAGVPGPFDFQAAGVTRYTSNNADCPTVICHPQRVFEEVETAFIKYLTDLLTPGAATDPLRRNFKTKFEDSFGVTISITI
jgi:hypothetical protein